MVQKKVKNLLGKQRYLSDSLFTVGVWVCAYVRACIFSFFL